MCQQGKYVKTYTDHVSKWADQRANLSLKIDSSSPVPCARLPQAYVLQYKVKTWRQMLGITSRESLIRQWCRA